MSKTLKLKYVGANDKDTLTAIYEGIVKGIQRDCDNIPRTWLQDGSYADSTTATIDGQIYDTNVEAGGVGGFILTADNVDVLNIFQDLIATVEEVEGQYVGENTKEFTFSDADAAYVEALASAFPAKNIAGSTESGSGISPADSEEQNGEGE